MRKFFLVLVAVVAGGLLAGPVSLQDLGPEGPSPYEAVEGWLEPFAGPGFAFGGNSGVHAESPDRIFVVQRGETRLPDPVPPGFAGFVGSIGINALTDTDGRTWQNCIYIVDSDGTVLEVWDQWDYLFQGSEGPGPHRIRISPYDPEKRVWVVHESGHQIFVFSNDGSELLATLGEKNVPGNDETHLGGPQDVAFFPDGRVMVADGIINGRVMILDADLNYITEFGGEPGDGRGRFNRPHGLALGPNGRIFVTDRDNRRVQVFNETTRSAWYHPNISPIATWPGFDLPLDVLVNQYDVFITDVSSSGASIVQLDLNGNRKYTARMPTEGPGMFREVHSFSVDTDGNLYGADNQHGRLQKLVPKGDADPGQLIGVPFVENGAAQ